MERHHGQGLRSTESTAQHSAQHSTEQHTTEEGIRSSLGDFQELNCHSETKGRALVGAMGGRWSFTGHNESGARCSLSFSVSLPPSGLQQQQEEYSSVGAYPSRSTSARGGSRRRWPRWRGN